MILSLNGCIVVRQLETLLRMDRCNHKTAPEEAIAVAIGAFILHVLSMYIKVMIQKD